ADAERPDVTDTTLGEMVAIMQRDDLAGAEKEKALGRIEIKTLDSLTVEELSGVYDMVRNLRYIGGRMSQANAEALTEIVRQAVNSMKAAKIGGKDKSPKATPSPADILGSDIKQVHYDQIALRQLVLEMDGWEYFGPVWNAFFQGIHDSSMDELKLKRETHEKLTEMFGNFGKARLLGLKGPKELKRTWFKTNEDGRRGVVLGNGKEWILSRRDRVMLALYWGSDYARDIILQNSKLPVTEPAVLEQLSFLSEDELNLVEEMWALNESFWPKVEATALAINGVAPPKVPHSPYVVNGREMPGGYMRIFYAEDPKDAKIPDRHNEAHLTMAGAHLAKNTKHGARVERVGSGGRELSLEMDNYFRAIEETIHDVTFAETARDSWRFLQHPEMVSAIYELYGKEHYRSMQGALTGMIAGGALDTDMFSKLLRYLRTNASLAYLGYSPRNFVQQPVAMANVINEIGEKYTAVGLAGFAGTPKEIKALKTLIQEKSEFMRYRPSVVNRETADIKNRLDSSALAGGYQRNAFWLQTKGDAAVAYPAWWGAYQQGLEKFGDEHRAVTYADETVAKTVGSGLLKDLPPLLQGVSEGRFKGRVELVKGFTFMMTFFNLIYQIQNETIKKNNLKTAEGISSAARSFFWVIAVQSLVSAALVLDLPDEGDDEGWAEWAAKSLASFSLSSVVFVRDIVSALTGFGLKTPYTKVVPATVSGAKKAGEILTAEEELSVENAAKLARTMGLIAPLPGSYALARMLEGVDHQERTGQGNIYSIAVEGKPR
ncbi:MAG TPA: hypothetical protein DCZ12_15880, partial [Gammaproteobacteria bacterium]|nr:hypothetical protein [Gammaproteobacteria bacterium]